MRELSPKKIWIQDDYLEFRLFSKIENCFLKVNAESAVTISSGLAKPLIAHSPYHYRLIKGLLSSELAGFFWEHLSNTLKTLGFPAPSVKAFNSPPFLSAKSFDTESHYALHAEPTNLFGPISYLYFLTDEADTELHFPRLSSLNSLASSLSHWPEFLEKFEMNSNSSIEFAEDVRIAPKKNRLVLFRPSLAHVVSGAKTPRSTLFRHHISGWPYAQDLKPLFREATERSPN